MNIAFEKWHGCQNDFIVIWMNPHQSQYIFDSVVQRAPELCARHSGIGGDGVIIIHHSPQDVLPRRVTVINRDGTIAKNCGNGLRCAAASIHQRLNKGGVAESFELLIEGSSVLAKILSSSSTEQIVSIAMGVPTLDEQNSWHENAVAKFKQLGSKGLSALATCEIGNQHILLFSDTCDEEALQHVAPAFQKDSAWDGINVHLVKESQVSRTHENGLGEICEAYQALSWERGVGPTYACGSGACAVSAHALAEGFISRDCWVEIQMRGGSLFCRQRSVDEPIELAGSALLVFKGEYQF